VVDGPDRDRALAEFAALYAAGRYFDAHEALEVVWRRSDALPMRFLQGMIQWSVAFEHHRRGNAHGALALLDRARANLHGAPPGYLGVDLSAWTAAAEGLRRAFAAWDAGGPRPEVAAPSIGVGTPPPPAVG
jgi:predicted metal-dependent hydrolase